MAATENCGKATTKIVAEGYGEAGTMVVVEVYGKATTTTPAGHSWEIAKVFCGRWFPLRGALSPLTVVSSHLRLRN